MENQQPSPSEKPTVFGPTAGTAMPEPQPTEPVSAAAATPAAGPVASTMGPVVASQVVPDPIVSEPVTPTAPPAQPGLSTGAAPFSQSDQPVATLKVLSVRGLEYAMMSASLWTAAAALAIILLMLVNGGTQFAILAFPVSLLVVTVPVFAFFFLRLKKAELAMPSLRFDPSKRFFSQVTQLFTFGAVMVSLVGLVYGLIAKLSGSLSVPLGKSLLDVIIVLAVTGGIFAYYWHDEHCREQG